MSERIEYSSSTMPRCAELIPAILGGIPHLSGRPTAMDGTFLREENRRGGVPPGSKQSSNWNAANGGLDALL